MSYWLLKTEPKDYSWDDLVNDGDAPWDGVKNALAQKNLKKMKKEDKVFIYHTGGERSIIGVGVVVKEPYPDENEKGNIYLVDVAPLEKLPRAISLREIKEDSFFADWELVRLPRLSVMPVPANIWEKIISLTESTA